MKFFISPEHKLINLFGDQAVVTPSLEDDTGADILFWSKKGSVGIQLKEIPGDLYQSLSDGRLARQTALLIKTINFPFLFLEGHWVFSADGLRTMLVGRSAIEFSRLQLRNLELSLRLSGILVEETNNLEDTKSRMLEIATYLDKEKHDSLLTRPKLRHGTWGTPSVSEEKLFFLQGLPNIGVTRAEAMLTCGSILDILNRDEKELAAIPGIGKTVAKRVFEFLR